MMSPAELVKIGLIGGILSFDYVSGLRLMLHQPIVAAPLTGYLLGDFGFGVTVGILLQLIYIGEVSVGASRADDVAIASVVSVASGAHMNVGGIAAASVAAGISFGHLGGLADMWVTRLNPILVEKIERRIEQGKFGRLWFPLLMAAVTVFLISGMISAIGSLATGYAFRHLLSTPPRFMEIGLIWGERLIPAVGIAVLLNSLQIGFEKLVFIITCVVTLLALPLVGFSVGIAIGISVAAIVSGIWIGKGGV